VIDKEAFLKHRLGESAVDLPGVGIVRVRGLSRAEAFRVQKAGDPDAMERLVVFLGLVEPRLTEDEVAAWYEAAPAGEIDLLVRPIQELSGLSEGAAKSGLPPVRRGRRT